MAYSTTLVFEIEGKDVDVVICACDVIAEGLYRGTRFNYDYGKRVPVNRWLCEQCLQNMEEMDDAEVRQKKSQSHLPEIVWELWNEWYEENSN